MISKKRQKLEYEKIKDITDIAERRIKLNALSKQVRLSNEVKFVLNSQSHHKFKTFIKAKAEECGSIVYDVNEDYTSQLCSKCGTLSNNYPTYRMKKCTHCNYEIDRDVNGSRNILMRYINK